MNTSIQLNYLARKNSLSEYLEKKSEFLAKKCLTFLEFRAEDEVCSYVTDSHACQLKVKTNLEQVFLVKSLRLGMPNWRLHLKTCGRAAIEEHFQQEAGNEV
ncbi:MAG: hypothetical protein V7L05_04735 [Nostoc sp.]|uniref:hypothetical protein n=1 Tax=Nostoc sp. TaxID=1180 RepID=UPI002FF763FC